MFLFDTSGRVLLQRRAAAKSLFGHRWANACCTHPRPGEDVVDAAVRRVREELGIRVDLTHVGTFTYEEIDEVSGQTEHELDHVLVGVTDESPVPDPAEADMVDWVDLQVLRDAAEHPKYAPWLRHALRAFPDLGPPSQA